MQRPDLIARLKKQTWNLVRCAGLIGFGLLLVTASLRAASPLENARRAQEMLGADRWSQLVRIENAAGSSEYPPIVFALVFELGGLLWFYTDTDGTQSLSLKTDDLAREQAELPRLLRAIDPGFTRHQVVPSAGTGGSRRWRGRLPQGCLIESYAELRRKLAQGDAVWNGRLLSLYYRECGRQAGHTVLTYETAAGTYVFDPLKPAYARRVDVRLTEDPLTVGRTLRMPFSVVQARWVPTTVSAMARVAARETVIAPGWRRTACGG